MLADIVAFLRNGGCVVKDLMPASHWVMAPLIGPVTVIESVIAPTQFAAVLFNFFAAGPFFAGKAASWFASSSHPDAGQWAQAIAVSTSSGISSEMAKATLAASVASRKQTSCVMLCKAIIGTAFVLLTLLSLHVPYPALINWMLLMLELALSYLLTVMAAGVVSGWQLAADMRRLAQSFESRMGDKAHPAVLPLLSAAGVISMPTAPWFKSVKPNDPFGANAVQVYIKSLEAVHGDFLSSLPKQNESIASSLFYHSRKQMYMTALDATTFALNAIAFLGYGMFPITYFIPQATLTGWAPAWPGHDTAQFWGNLAGDAAWTVEAALVLTVPILVGSLLGAAPSKVKKE